MTTQVEKNIKAFGMTGFQIFDDLKQAQKNLNVDLGFDTANEQIEIKESLKQFEQKTQNEAAEMAVCYQIFYCLERSIRDLISNTLVEKFGQQWWETDCVPPNIKTEVTRRRQEELNSGVTPRSDVPIDFTTFGELEVIITSNWKSFETVFDSQRAMQRVMKSLNVLRGPIAHCCAYSDDEKDRLLLTVKDWVRML